MNDVPEALALRAGPPPISPPVPIALMIVALGIIGPFLFVRDGVPSVFLTAMTILLPVAGIVTVIATIDALRRRSADPAVRPRAMIGQEHIALLPRPGQTEIFAWEDIADVQVSRSVMVIHLRNADGRRTRYALRYSRLETPVATVQGRVAAAQERARERMSDPPMSSKLH